MRVGFCLLPVQVQHRFRGLFHSDRNQNENQGWRAATRGVVAIVSGAAPPALRTMFLYGYTRPRTHLKRARQAGVHIG